ncbi:hypothetical protein [Andreprevotia sp. IGB-42]|uniref:hypothetical protein n=1 Tax=Andreprevotia sp. IGB-42 TaxID=2497473 RepID=UPI001357922D|nr:hypothetical protein [Andreprevotia sp. IGB-42]
MTSSRFWGGVLALVIGSVIAFAAYSVWQTMAPIKTMQDTNERLQQQGKIIKGQVIAIEQTDTVVNNKPVARISVRYQQSGEQREASFDQIMPLTALPRVQPGLPVPLRVDDTPAGAVMIDLVRLQHPEG